MSTFHEATRRTPVSPIFPALLAGTLAFATAALAEPSDSLSPSVSQPAPRKDSLCRMPSGFFLNTPISLKESRSVFAIGAGGFGPKWGSRLDVGVMEDHLDPREPLSLDLTWGLYWKHNTGTPLALYEGITLTDQMGLYHSFEGHAVSMAFLAGCEFRPDQSKDAFFVEVGTGGAFTERGGSYRGGTVFSAGLRHYAEL